MLPGHLFGWDATDIDIYTQVLMVYKYIYIYRYMHRIVGAGRENEFATRFQLRQVIAMRWKHGGSSWFFATFIMACSLGQCRGSWATLSGLRGTDPKWTEPPNATRTWPIRVRSEPEPWGEACGDGEEPMMNGFQVGRSLPSTQPPPRRHALHSAPLVAHLQWMPK